MTEATYTPPPVTGYRKLTQYEVDLMNAIKAKGDELGALVERLRMHVASKQDDEPNPFPAVLDQRAVSIGATEIQTGLMWLCSAVAQPTNF